jgi:NAD(P)-dependent dehydrogenase (short-subunit alcohol dehydrogenase family)
MREERRRRIPLGRIGTAEDVAYGVLYLASDEASWITGSELVIDGGITAQ